MTTLHNFAHGDSSWFIQDRFGMFIHWGLYSLAARHEKVRFWESISPEKYYKYVELFNPTLFDPKKWAKIASYAGMKYVVFTAKHHDGFCMWDSAYTEYKCTNTPGGRDYLEEIIDAYRSEGLRIGIYYSLLDWHHPEFTIDRCHPERNNRDERGMNTNRDMHKYAKYMQDQVTELLTNYGKIDILWFDFSYPGEDGKCASDWESEKLLETVRALQPDVLIDNRLDLPGSGDIMTPEQFMPANGMRDEHGNLQIWEGCHTFSGSWGYYRDENTWKTVEMLLQLLVNNVSRGGNTLLNVGPNGRGELDERATARLEDIATWMRLHHDAIYNCTIAPDWVITPDNCRFTYNLKTNRLYLHIFSWPLKELHLLGFKGRLKYAQLLNDASEICFRSNGDSEHEFLVDLTPVNAVTLLLPIVRPNVVIPVIELVLK